VSFPARTRRAISARAEAAWLDTRVRAHARGDRLARRLNVAALYETSAGVKHVNPLFKDTMGEAYVSGAPQECDPGELRVGFDALRDPVTMLETPISDSPHAGLMRALLHGESPAETEYVARARAGTLDWQRPRWVPPRSLEKFRQTLAKLQEGAEEPVLRVAWLDGTGYVVDGKHRAAAAHVSGRKVMCETATGIFCDSYFQWIAAVMAGRPESYESHLRFFERVRQQQTNR
jgi:hypothetical protein